MKITVKRKDGLETLTLTEPLTIERGDPLNVLVTSTGMRHYFTAEGIYDGWEMDVSGMGFQSWEEAKAFAEKVDSERDIEEESRG